MQQLPTYTYEYFFTQNKIPFQDEKIHLETSLGDQTLT